MIKKWKLIKKSHKFILASVVLIGLSVVFMSTNERDFEISKNLDIFVSLFREVDLYYVDPKTPEQLIDASINGMLESLDPYTTFIPEKDMANFKFMTTGQYGGIGALIRKGGDYTIISEPYEGSPALKAGLRAGDTIFSINGVSIKGKPISDVSDMLKGKPDTQLKMVIKGIEDKEPVEKVFDREKIVIKNVPYYGFVKDKIGYIRLNSFTQNAGQDVRDAFKALKSQGAKAVILDLRGNPGGLLNEAVGVASIWLKKGQEVVYTHGKIKQYDNVYRTEKAPVDTLMPIAILVNHGSASASEIVSGSLQDLDRAIIVGERTFGKGLVQTTRPLSYNTNLKITTAKYYIPSGRCIQALDYSHRNPDGSVGHIPDSLISAFKTKNGRTVYDGGGIKPDITVEADNPSNISVSLYSHNLFFDYATLFAAKHDSIPPADKFQITDDIFNNFVKFVLSKKFDYNTESSEKLDELIKTVKSEGYYSVSKNDLNDLQKKFVPDKMKDMQTFKKEIEDLLRDEIVSRYYYQKGRIISNLEDDPQLDKAISLLEQKGAVTSILHGTFEGSNIRLAMNNTKQQIKKL